MRKDEFLKEIGELKYSKSFYNDNDYAREQGFKECKEQVIKLATDLDVDGLSMESLKIVRDTLNETATVYGDLIKTQKQLYDARKEITRLQNNQTDIRDQEKNQIRILQTALSLAACSKDNEERLIGQACAKIEIEDRIPVKELKK